MYNISVDDLVQVNDNIDTWAYMSSPYPVISLLTSYIAFVSYVGPHYMKNRSPYNLTNVLVAYNAVQVVVSCFLLYNGTQYLLTHGLVHKECVSHASKDINYTIIKLGYYYMWAKVSELLDTVFFVLRKKQSQVTFLHVYHHSIMMSMMWIGLKYARNENFMFMGTLNSAVHVIMYAYYGLSAYPSLQKYLWWKKYITKMQLIQFLLIFIQLTACRMISDCPPSMAIFYFALLNLILFYYLFNNFYKNCYVQPKNNAIDKIK